MRERSESRPVCNRRRSVLKLQTEMVRHFILGPAFQVAEQKRSAFRFGQPLQFFIEDSQQFIPRTSPATASPRWLAA